MKSWQQRRSFWALLAAAALGSACTVMDQRATLVETPQLSKIQIARLTFVVLDGKTCNGDLGQDCPIRVSTFVHAGTKYCVAVAPRVNLKRRTGSDQQKKVVWKLEGDELVNGKLDGKPVAFHGESGIVIAYETASKHVVRGGLGDGGSRPDDPMLYHMKVNREKPANTKSSYLPVVIWGSGGNEELCAAVDPLIFNEP